MFEDIDWQAEYADDPEMLANIEMHFDGVHDGEMFKWMHFCVCCEWLIDQAVDSAIDSVFE